MAYAGYSDAEILARPRYALELIIGGLTLSDPIRGKNIMTGLCNLYQDGYRLGSVYQLYEVDNDHSGLFSNTGVPLAPAVYMHNFSTILNDPGATKTTFSPAGLAVTVNGLPASARWHLFQKSTGSWQVVIWNNVANWNNATQAPIVIPPTTVSLTFPFQGTVSVYDPTTGVVPTSTTNNTTTASVSLTDHVIVVDYLQTTIVPPVPTPPPPVPAPTPGGESVQGTIITVPGQPAIIDRLGNAWTLVSSLGGQAAVNGTVDQTTNAVHLLLYWGRRIYQQSDPTNDWYYKSIPSDAWTAATDPRVTPTPVPVPVPTPPPTPTPTPTPNPPSANFRVLNGQIIHPNGTVFRGRGMNFFDGDMAYARDFALPNLPNLDFIRLACGEAGQNNFAGDDVAALSWFINDMSSRNIVVVIENHNTAQDLSTVDFAGQESWIAELARAFTSPYVWFASSNEPLGDLATEQTMVYNAVRNAGNNNIVVLTPGASTWVTRDMDPATYRNMKNIIFDFHYYPWEPGETASPSQVQADFAARTAEITAFTRSLDGAIPIMIGEWDGWFQTSPVTGWYVIDTVENSGLPATWWWLGPGAIGAQIIDGRNPWTWSADGAGINVRDWIQAGVGPQPPPFPPTPTPTPAPLPAPTPTPTPYWDAGFGNNTAWMSHGNHQGNDPWAYGFKGGAGGGLSESDGYWSDPPLDNTPQTFQVEGSGVRMGCVNNTGGFTNAAGNPAACVSAIIVNFDFSGGLFRQYGYYEFSVRLDNVRGFLFHWDIEDYNPWNEIDIDVWIDGSGVNHVWANDVTGNGVFCHVTDVNVTQTHSYGLDWQSGYVRFYIDGVLRGSTGNNYNRPFGTYILTDTATYINSNAIQSLPAYAHIGYYRVWNTKP